MSMLDYLLLALVAACAVLAIRTYRRGGSCRCGSNGCAGCKGDRRNCPNCRQKDKNTT